MRIFLMHNGLFGVNLPYYIRPVNNSQNRSIYIFTVESAYKELILKMNSLHPEFIVNIQLARSMYAKFV